jgi:hypothetical protein
MPATSGLGCVQTKRRFMFRDQTMVLVVSEAVDLPGWQMKNERQKPIQRQTCRLTRLHHLVKSPGCLRLLNLLPLQAVSAQQNPQFQTMADIEP